jgi:hypothetical protein
MLLLGEYPLSWKAEYYYMPRVQDTWINNLRYYRDLVV